MTPEMADLRASVEGRVAALQEDAEYGRLNDYGAGLYRAFRWVLDLIDGGEQ